MCVIELRHVAPSARAITQAFSLKCLRMLYLGLRAFSPLTLGFYNPGRWPDEIVLPKYILKMTLPLMGNSMGARARNKQLPTAEIV